MSCGTGLKTCAASVKGDTMDNIVEKWPEIIEYLRREFDISEVAYSTWLKPVRLDRVEDEKIVLLVEDKFAKEYMNKKYTPMIKTAIREVTGADLEIVFVTA